MLSLLNANVREYRIYVTQLLNSASMCYLRVAILFASIIRDPRTKNSKTGLKHCSTKCIGKSQLLRGVYVISG